MSEQKEPPKQPANIELTQQQLLMLADQDALARIQARKKKRDIQKRIADEARRQDQLNAEHEDANPGKFFKRQSLGVIEYTKLAAQGIAKADRKQRRNDKISTSRQAHKQAQPKSQLLPSNGEGNVQQPILQNRTAPLNSLHQPIRIGDYPLPQLRLRNYPPLVSQPQPQVSLSPPLYVPQQPFGSPVINISQLISRQQQRQNTPPAHIFHLPQQRQDMPPASIFQLPQFSLNPPALIGDLHPPLILFQGQPPFQQPVPQLDRQMPARIPQVPFGSPIIRIADLPSQPLPDQGSIPQVHVQSSLHQQKRASVPFPRQGQLIGSTVARLIADNPRPAPEPVPQLYDRPGFSLPQPPLPEATQFLAPRTPSQFYRRQAFLQGNNIPQKSPDNRLIYDGQAQQAARRSRQKHLNSVRSNSPTFQLTQSQLMAELVASTSPQRLVSVPKKKNISKGSRIKELNDSVQQKKQSVQARVKIKRGSKNPKPLEHLQRPQQNLLDGTEGSNIRQSVQKKKPEMPQQRSRRKMSINQQKAPNRARKSKKQQQQIGRKMQLEEQNLLDNLGIQEQIPPPRPINLDRPGLSIANMPLPVVSMDGVVRQYEVNGERMPPANVALARLPERQLVIPPQVRQKAEKMLQVRQQYKESMADILQTKKKKDKRLIKEQFRIQLPPDKSDQILAKKMDVQQSSVDAKIAVLRDEAQQEYQKLASRIQQQEKQRKQYTELSYQMKKIKQDKQLKLTYQERAQRDAKANDLLAWEKKLQAQKRRIEQQKQNLKDKSKVDRGRRNRFVQQVQLQRRLAAEQAAAAKQRAQLLQRRLSQQKAIAKIQQQNLRKQMQQRLARQKQRADIQSKYANEARLGLAHLSKQFEQRKRQISLQKTRGTAAKISQLQKKYKQQREAMVKDIQIREREARLAKEQQLRQLEHKKTVEAAQLESERRRLKQLYQVQKKLRQQLIEERQRQRRRIDDQRAVGLQNINKQYEKKIRQISLAKNQGFQQKTKQLQRQRQKMIKRLKKEFEMQQFQADQEHKARQEEKLAQVQRANASILAEKVRLQQQKILLQEQYRATIDLLKSQGSHKSRQKQAQLQAELRFLQQQSARIIEHYANESRAAQRFYQENLRQAQHRYQNMIINASEREAARIQRRQKAQIQEEHMQLIESKRLQLEELLKRQRQASRVHNETIRREFSLRKAQLDRQDEQKMRQMSQQKNQAVSDLRALLAQKSQAQKKQSVFEKALKSFQLSVPQKNRSQIMAKIKQKKAQQKMRKEAESKLLARAKYQQSQQNRKAARQQSLKKHRIQLQVQRQRRDDPNLSALSIIGAPGASQDSRRRRQRRQARLEQQAIARAQLRAIPWDGQLFVGEVLDSYRLLNLGNLYISQNKRGAYIWLGHEIVKPDDSSYYTKNCVFFYPDDILRLIDSYQRLLLRQFRAPALISTFSMTGASVLKDIYKGKPYYGIRMVQYVRDQGYPTRVGFNLSPQEMAALVEVIKQRHQ